MASSEEVERLRNALRVLLERFDPDGRDPRLNEARRAHFETASPPRHPAPEGQGLPDRPLPARCPSCGEADLRHVQDVEEVRVVVGWNDRGALVIQGSSTIVEEVAINEHLWCSACHQESELPPEVEYT